jgi:hypothetical protein
MQYVLGAAMKRNLPAGITCLAIALILEPSLTVLRGQQRLPNRIDTQQKTILRRSRTPRIEGLVSDGAVEDSMRVSGISFRFTPTYEQQMELERLLRDQQDPSSPMYHAWLTAEEYGGRFGLKPDDYSRVREWIVSQGFQVDYVAKSRTHISFSGSAAQVRKTFGTELHYYRVDGKKHFANVSEVEIPSELAGLVYTIRGLDDFPEQRAGKIIRAANSNGEAFGLTPDDLTVIYNLNPLYRQGISGAGQKIVVAGQSGFDIQDVRKFRYTMGLPPSDPKIILMPGVRDPGLNEASAEALLGVELAGGVAFRASILYVYGPDAARATEYAVDQNLAPIVSYSFVSCEKQNTGVWGWFRNVVQQAAAQGITWVAASGDTGPAGCESQLKDSAGANGVTVNLPASVPEVTGVGGTEFTEGKGSYWSSTPGGDVTSAQSYIPERGWNDSAAGKLLAASGGGASAAFPRPDWQTGPGVPDDNARHVPDIAFSASLDHDPYLIVMKGDFATTGGTSASTPFFAGVLALLNEYVVENEMQAKPGLGNINPHLYQLAQNTPGVFHDITAGDNIIPCRAGTSNCTIGQYGYRAGFGYDHVTGLGSIDIANLFEGWSATTPHRNPTTNVVVSVEPSPVYKQAPDKDGYPWFCRLYVNETSGAPARITAFSVDDSDLGDDIAAWFGTVNLPAKGVLSADLKWNDLDVPSDHVFAVSGIDSAGKPWSQQATARFLGEKSGAAMSLASNPAVVRKTGKGDPSCPADHPFHQALALKELNGTAVILNRFLAGGADYTDKIADWFGSTRLPALGTVQTGLCWAIQTTPVTLSYEIDGVDDTGRYVNASLRVDFISPDEQSAMVPSEAGPVGSGSAVPALTTPPALAGTDLIVSPLRSKPALANGRK